ncbi:LPS assembly lipoprotein LptE [Brevundimonas sp. SL130]|uniref:LPS assembly lipoprotein LptE n=1 Tax=Brevundimonas sp. SL130 TaxID=2995143 RepID=UPI00226CEF07|nr:LPS assembly lipoprotein LptE [Brevundimonas sp. SL130]WAC59983.1 LPS assembly lipoprotein LptE [Brevundimonas sp. SL130]
MRGAAVFVVLGALAVSACGFTPMYAEPGVGSPLRRIAVSAQDDRLGYRLREQLEDALGWDRSAAPLYRLTAQVEQERRSLGRRIDDTATRYELTVKARWTLTPADGGAPVTGEETVTTTYAAADQPYAAIAAQQDGEERAASELARRIRLDLMQALSNR